MRLIKRNLYSDIKNHLSKKEITLIIGARQVGKTTIMKQLQKELTQKGERTVFFNLDREMDKKYFESQSLLLRKIELEIGRKNGFVFIDEIQRKENAGLFLKGIYDSDLPYKFIVSGSGSLELKEKIHESLIGRKKIFELTPISVDEFINFKTNYKYENNIVDFFEIEKEKASLILEEYLNYGGYPKVVLAETEKEKMEEIDEIFRSYLERDITYLIRTDRIDVFSILIKLLAAQTGELINYSKLSTYLNTSIQTIKNYLWLAEKTFIIKKITPYFTNPQKEITKSPIYYFYDIGLRNYGISKFGKLSQIELGFAFENITLNILQEKIRLTPATIHFWRTKEKAEVDFILNYTTQIVPIEVKYKHFKQPTITRSMRSFIEKYNPKTAFIINLNLETIVKIDKTEVKFIPFYKLLQTKIAG